MAEITRICPNCGKSFPLESRHCSHCGYDIDASLPVPQNNLPELMSKAALPVLVGAASLAVSMGWKLLQGMLNRPARTTTQAIQPQATTAIQPQSRMTIRIKTSWVVGDSNGNWREGHTDQTIEIQ